MTVAGLTRALVARHALGRAEAYDAALLDVAQDHLLYLLSQTVQFGDNRLVFKGGQLTEVPAGQRRAVLH